MKTWIRLYEQHRSVRNEAGEQLGQELRARLKGLADRDYCDGAIVGRFNHRNKRGLREWYIGNDDGRVALVGLPTVSSASLTVLALVDAQNHHVHQFTAMLEGLNATGQPLTVAVHLEDDRGDQGDRKGSGACAHAALHCHVGPNQYVEPKLRVPFGAVGPVQALDWLLSSVVPDWEPAPWAAVMAVLAEKENQKGKPR